MKRQVMKRAHQIAKQLIGDFRARIALALRIAWREVKKAMENTANHPLVKKLEELSENGVIRTARAAVTLNESNFIVVESKKPLTFTDGQNTFTVETENRCVNLNELIEAFKNTVEFKTNAK